MRIAATLFTLMWGSISVAHAQELKPNLQPTMKAVDQLSCAHLQSRYEKPAQIVGMMNRLTDSVGADRGEYHGMELYDYFQRKVGYAPVSLLSEVVYTGTLNLKQLPELELAQMQAYAFLGAGGLEFHQEAPRSDVELRVRAINLCFGEDLNLVLYSNCPVERVVFGDWQSDPFVVRGSDCKSQRRFPIDLTTERRELGHRIQRVGGAG